ncbi:hypothetical protein [Halorientalis halophila]|uniref:hypothetical protein n=1 Tax=Halorientalis halophila TaxID=3108499 RepID=UPI00300902DB
MQYHNLLLVLVLATAFAAPASATTSSHAGAPVTADAGTAVVGSADFAIQDTNETQNETQNETDGEEFDEEDAEVIRDFFGFGGDSEDGGDGGFFTGLAANAIEQAMIGFLNGIAEDSEEVAREFDESGVVFDFPAPGDPGDPPSWVNPDAWSGTTEGERWQGTFTYHWVFGFLGFAGLLPALMLAMGKGNRKPDRGTAKRFVRGFVMILLGWIVIALCYHLADAVTQIVAPPAGTEQGVRGYVDVLQAANLEGHLGAVIGGAKGMLLTTALGVLYIQYVLAFVCAAIWPVMWVLMAYRSTIARSAGKIALTFMGALIVIKLLQATIFHFLVAFEFESPVVRETAYTVGITLAFMLLPYTVLAKMMPRTLLIFGLHELREKGHEDRRYQQRIGNVRRKFNQSLRRGPDGGVDQVGPANRGSKGLPSGQPRELNSARSDGGRGLPRGQPAEGPDGDGPNTR